MGATARPVEPSRFRQPLPAHIQADGFKPQCREKGGLMASPAAGHQHPAGGLGHAGIVAQGLLQGRRGAAQLPAIAPLPIALIPGGGHPGVISSHGEAPGHGDQAPARVCSCCSSRCRRRLCTRWQSSSTSSLSA